MKRIFSAFILFCIVTAGKAQERIMDQTNISFGVKGGPGMTKFNVKQAESFSGKWRPEWVLNFHAGAFVTIPVAAEGKFALQPEVLFARQGSKINQTVTSNSGTTTLRTFKQSINYINVPLMLQFRVPSGFYFEAGPQLSLLLGAKQKGPDTQEYDHKEQRNKQDLSISFGAGHVSKNCFALGVRYAHGTKDIIKEGFAVDNREFRNAAIFLNFRYFIF